MRYFFTQKKGFSVMEVMLSGAIFALFATAFIGAIIYAQQNAQAYGSRIRAAFIAEEGMEIVRNIRDVQFSELVDGTFGLAKNGNTWALAGTNDTVDVYTRSVSISTIDAQTKKADVSVSWPETLQRTGLFTLTAHFTNWAATTINSWASPYQESALDISGNQDGIRIATAGNYAYMVRNGGTPDFVVIDMTNTAAPVIAGTLSLAGNPVNIAISGNYAYVTSDANNAELQIISLANPNSPAVVGTYNAPGNANGGGIAVSGSYVYLGRSSSSDPELSIINVTNPANPALTGTLQLSDSVNDAVTTGSHLVIASNSNSAELQIVSILNPATPVLTGIYNISGSTDGLSVDMKGESIAMLGAADESLYAISIANPGNPALLSSFAAGGRVYDVSLGNDDAYAFLATNAPDEFQVVDVSATSTITLFSSLNTTSTPAAVAYNSTLDRAVMATAGNSDECIIIAPL